MKFTYRMYLIGICWICILASCTTISYTPTITLDVSPVTIQKSLQIERFVNISSSKDFRNPLLGLSVTNKDALPGEFELTVTNAIVSDFSNNAVFEHVSRRETNPDYIMEGRIIKFSGKSRYNALGYTTVFAATIFPFIFIPIDEDLSTAQKTLSYILMVPLFATLVGVPVFKNTADVEIEVSIYDRTGEIKCIFKGYGHKLDHTSTYKNKSMAVPNLTNQAFSEAIAQIRQQIITELEAE